MPASRGDFGLPATGALYICPERLEKFHPDCDPLFAEVLRRDPEGHLVLLEGDRPHPVSIFAGSSKRPSQLNVARRSAS